jgi:hypothetical protein
LSDSRSCEEGERGHTHTYSKENESKQNARKPHIQAIHSNQSQINGSIQSGSAANKQGGQMCLADTWTETMTTTTTTATTTTTTSRHRT